MQKFLKSGTFTIRKVASNKKGIKDYLNVDNGKLIVNDSPRKWVLSMQGMKPSHLRMKYINMDQYNVSFKAYPTLLEPGSGYGKKWILALGLTS